MASCTAFVGNLSWDTTNESLADHFDAEFPVTSAVVQRHADSQRSKGWGLVTFEKEGDLELAIEKFADSVLDGRTLIARADRGATVSTGERKPRQTRQPRRQQNDTKTTEDEVATPSTKLFVGNLTWDTTSEELEKYFETVGDVVSAEVIFKNDTSPPRSRGWGIVEMGTLDDANAALDLNESDLKGREIKVEFQKVRARTTRAPRARRQPREPREPREEVEAEPSKSVYIGNLPWSYQDEDLCDLFKDLDVSGAEVKQGADGRSRGYGIVNFDSEDAAAKAIAEVNNTDCDGRTVVVRFDRGAFRSN